VSLSIDRETLTHAAIVLGACSGTWMAVVRPEADRLAEVETAIAEARQRTAAAMTAPVEPLADRAPRVNSSAAEIAARSRLARDSARLVGLVMDLAAASGVEVRTIQPQLEPAQPGRRHAATRVDIGFEGAYGQAVVFLAGLEGAAAYLRMSSVQITPGKGPGSASVQVTCQTLGFDLPEAIAGIVPERRP
jgi:hypothetical protein